MLRATVRMAKAEAKFCCLVLVSVITLIRKQHHNWKTILFSLFNVHIVQ